MNRAPPNMAQRKDKSFADEVCAPTKCPFLCAELRILPQVERYEQWKKEREQRLG